MGRRAGSEPLATKGVGVYNLEQTWKLRDAIDETQGRRYYREFQSRIYRIADRCMCPPNTAAAVYAALSPNNSEENCMLDMERAVSMYRTMLWNKFHPTTYSANKAKAYRILNGEAPDLVLVGEKTNNFYHNIIDPTGYDYVTVDGHMVNIWNGKRVPLDFAGVSKSEYRIVASGVKELAARLGLVPCQLQAVLWLTWRRVHRILYQPQFKLNFNGEC